LIGESSLRRAVSEFDSHYHTERNHRLENKIIRPEFAEFPDTGTVHSGRDSAVYCGTTFEKPHESAFVRVSGQYGI
jgi:hypothetical protein